MLIYHLIIICLYFFKFIKPENDIWSYQLWLDPYEKYSVKWNLNDSNETITFLCEVETKGWIGFGLSPNGGMKGSDVIIGWVDDKSGKTFFQVSKLYYLTY